MNKNPYSAAKGGKRADLDDQYFRSAWEANWARYLRWLVELGEIVKWEYEPKTFEFPVRRGARFYTPDFCITEKDQSVRYEEIKGWMDPVSKTKLKRMAKYHPEIELRVISQKEYAVVSKMAKAIIPGWEIRPKHSH